MLLQLDPRGIHEAAAFWYPCEGRRASDAVVYCRGTKPELIVSVMQTGRFVKSVGDSHTTRGIQAVYATRVDGWCRAFGHAIGVPLFNSRYCTLPMWVVSTVAGRARGAGGGWQDVYPLSSEGLRVEGLMLFVIDLAEASTDNFSGSIRGV